VTSDRPTPDCYWVAPRFLAGNYPRTRDEATSRDKLRRILDAGVTRFVDLTTGYDPLEPYEHLLEEMSTGRAGEPFVTGRADTDRRRAVRTTFPVPDLSTPLSREQTRAILDTIDRELEDGGTVYLHCWGGVGRTGTIVGCWLVRHGMEPGEALKRVAELWSTRPGSEWTSSPQTPDQFRYVREWREG